MKPGSELASIIVCPITHQPLTLASNETVTQCNAAIATGVVTDSAGNKVTERIDAALVRADGTVYYPVRGGIPSLLPTQGIRMGS